MESVENPTMDNTFLAFKNTTAFTDFSFSAIPWMVDISCDSQDLRERKPCWQSVRMLWWSICLIIDIHNWKWCHQTLKDLNPHKASGPDQIPTRLLKLCASDLAPAIARVFQTSLNSGTVPSDWKLAVIPKIFESESRVDSLSECYDGQYVSLSMNGLEYITQVFSLLLM
jgi:hypothetical protein